MSFLKDFPRLLESEYQRYWFRLRKSGVTKRELREGPPSSWFLSHYHDVKKFLGERIRKSDYEFSYLLKTELIKGPKKRVIYVPNNWDRILVGCLREYLTKITEPTLSDSLYSFRSGRGPLTAGLSIRKFLYKNRDKSLYVSQRDVSKYGDSIDINKLESILTSTYEELLKDESAIFLLKKTLRWPIQNENKEIITMSQGIPAGTPLVPLFENLYLSKFDKEMDELQEKENIFYGRYGDDIIWIGPDRALINSLTQQLEVYCREHSLEVKNKKAIDFEFKKDERIKWLGNLLDNRGYFIADRVEIKSFKTKFKIQLHKIWHKSEQWKILVDNNQDVLDIWLKEVRNELLMKNNPLLLKLLHLKDGDLRLKQIDSWVREQIVHFLLKKNIKKKESWKIIRKHKLPSLNLQRRKYAVKLERLPHV
ncbi:MAG: reverse transcriptase domain-containing protein [Bacteriovoracaceae bacterium]